MPAVLNTKTKHFSNLTRRNSSVIALRSCVVLLFLAPLLFAGCGMQQKSVQSGPGSFRILPKKYEQKALDFEARGQLPKAIQSWQIVLKFRPNDLKIKERISSLGKKARIEAAGHFNRGEFFFKKGQLHNARREFLLTLAYDPNNSRALDYVEKKLRRPVLEPYMVQPGDTVRKIAEKEFRDPDKGFLLTLFNHLDSSDELTPGTLLQIPLLDSNIPDGRGDDHGLSGRAAMFSTEKSPGPEKKGGTSTAAAYSSRKTVAKAEGKKGDAPRDMAIYQKAKEYLEQEEYQKSLKMLLSIDINYRDVRQLIASTEVFLQQEADAHYRKGISYFLTEDLDKAIAEWEEVLRLMPNDLRAKKDLQNARKMQKRVKKY